jgi:hypothetical protein
VATWARCLLLLVLQETLTVALLQFAPPAGHLVHMLAVGVHGCRSCAGAAQQGPVLAAVHAYLLLACADPALLCLSAVPCPSLVLPLLCSSSSTLAQSRNTQLLHARLHMHANAAVTHFTAPLHCGCVGSRRRRQAPPP